MKRKSKVSKVRFIVQALFLIIVLYVAVGHTLAESGASLPLIQGASLHAICPFGGVVTIYRYVTEGTFVQKIHESSFYLMLIVLATAIIAGPLFCGWVCPFGTVQEWFAKIGRKIFGKRYNTMIPQKVDRYLRHLRYFVLAWVIWATATSAKLVFADYDPYYALFNFWTGEVAVTAFIALALVLILSLFIERPFCKYACPYGAFLGLTNLFRVFSVRRNASTCISCSKCDKACPMNLTVSNTDKVRDPQCISCLECTSEAACPVPLTMELTTKGKGETK